MFATSKPYFWSTTTHEFCRFSINKLGIPKIHQIPTQFLSGRLQNKCLTMYHATGPSNTVRFLLFRILWRGKQSLSYAWGALAVKIVMSSCFSFVTALNYTSASLTWIRWQFCSGSLVWDLSQPCPIQKRHSKRNPDLGRF